MINPVHRLKKFVKYAGNEPPTSHYVTETAGWLGSGLTDKNGIEIFEGDRVKIGGNDVLPVIFDDAAFWLDDNEFFLYHFEPSEIEIVGHVKEEKP